VLSLQSRLVSAGGSHSKSQSCPQFVRQTTESAHVWRPDVVGHQSHVLLAFTSTPVCYLREYPARGRSSFAMIPVQPVWWEAPTPLPVSPSKYSWNRGSSGLAGISDTRSFTPNDQWINGHQGYDIPARLVKHGQVVQRNEFEDH